MAVKLRTGLLASLLFTACGNAGEVIGLESLGGRSDAGTRADARPHGADGGGPFDALALIDAGSEDTGSDAGSTNEPTGWDDPPGTGLLFVVDSITADPHDISGLSPIAGLIETNLRQRLVVGQALFLVEISGLELPYRGQDSDLTLKVYQGIDADDPPFPANNFGIPPGETSCCGFKIDPRSLAGLPPQARSRMRGRISQGHFRTLVAANLEGLEILPTGGLADADITFDLPASTDSLSFGRIRGAVRPISLASIMVGDTSWLDQVVAAAPPDVDLSIPSNGLDRYVLGANGRVAQCQQACGTDGCLREILGFDPAAPWTCALRPEMEDGFTATFRFHAVPAHVVGVGP